jgi:hypothetical protein
MRVFHLCKIGRGAKKTPLSHPLTQAVLPNFHNIFHPISTSQISPTTTRYCVIGSYGIVAENFTQNFTSSALNGVNNRFIIFFSNHKI